MAMRQLAFRIIFSLTLILLAGLSSQSIASGISNQMYLGLVDRAKTQTEGFDFKGLRGAYENSDYYKPTVKPAEDMPLILEQIDNQVPGAEDYLASYVGNNFPLAEVHTQLVAWYEKKGDKEKVAYHTWLANGLLNAILKFSDGQGHETAYRVINHGEVGLIMQMKDYQVQGIRQWPTADGRLYEIVKGINPDSRQVEELWFDLTSIQAKNPR